jgi:hypothetical protein
MWMRSNQFSSAAASLLEFLICVSVIEYDNEVSHHCHICNCSVINLSCKT